MDIWLYKIRRNTEINRVIEKSAGTQRDRQWCPSNQVEEKAKE